jgi:hypothetical protein
MQVPTWASILYYPLFNTGVWWRPLACCFTRRLTRVIYNVFFYPISRFPGPCSATITQWWLHTCISVGGSVYLPCVRTSNRNTVFFPWHSFCWPYSIDVGQGDIIRIAPNARQAAYDAIYVVSSAVPRQIEQSLSWSPTSCSRLALTSYFSLIFKETLSKELTQACLLSLWQVPWWSLLGSYTTFRHRSSYS